jgi:hypothetical protein
MTGPEDKDNRKPDEQEAVSTAGYGGAGLGPGAQIGAIMTLKNRITRRQFVGSSLAVPLLGAVQPGKALAANASKDGGGFEIYWGDLHNHNSVGYAKGSMERAFRIARELLDFYAFTPHSWWHDMPKVDEKTFSKFHNGFKITRRRWPDVLKMVADYHDPGKFVTFPGYEWHSSGSGDYCVIFPYDDAPLETFPDLKSLQDFARKRQIIVIPHHPGNKQGNRGANFDMLDTDVSPILEVFSEWGSAERDDGPYPYIRHSHGGVWTKNTLQYALNSGLRLGVIASTDDHFGYPGGYREGLAAVLAPELTREAIYDALRNRRTYGVSGDRIALDFRLNGSVMGQSVRYDRRREIAVRVSGWDDVEAVEVVRNGKVIHRDHPVDRDVSATGWSKPVLLRIQFGWGPWASLDAARVCDWDFDVELSSGAINAIQPCFQSGPCEETKIDRILNRTKRSCRVQSYTSRRQAFAEDDTKGIVLDLSGGPETRISLQVEKPVKLRIDQPLKDFIENNEIYWTGSYPSESIRIHRLAFADRYTTEFSVTDSEKSGGVDWYYIRVKQANGQLAWSSPIWVGTA